MLQARTREKLDTVTKRIAAGEERAAVLADIGWTESAYKQAKNQAKKEAAGGVTVATIKPPKQKEQMMQFNIPPDDHDQVKVVVMKGSAGAIQGIAQSLAALLGGDL